LGMSCSSLPSTGTPSVPLLISTDGGVRNRHSRRSSFASDVASDLHYQSQLHLLALPNVKVADLWRGYGPQPWKRATFKFSTDPQLDAKVRDVVGLYLKHPENAAVPCVGEKPEAQALDQTSRSCRSGPDFRRGRPTIAFGTARPRCMRLRRGSKTAWDTPRT